MEEWFRIGMGYLILLVEACGALVVVLGVVRAITEYIRTLVRPESVLLASLRVRLGQSMVVGLEFQVAADILKTGLSPTWNDVLLLAALIGLRTVLNYILERELKMLDPR